MWKEFLHPWFGSALYVTSVLVLALLFRRAAMKAIEWSSLRGNQSEILQKGFIPLLKNLITVFVFTTGGIMILKHFGYDVMSLVAALGVGSLAVGLAAKDTLSNMISGFTLIIDRNMRPGDRINLGGFTGDVEEIGLRSTRIRLGNGNTLIVPNAELMTTKIINLSQPTRASACSTTLRIPFSVPFSRVRQLCLSTIGELEARTLDKPASVILAGVSEGYQQVSVTFWIPDSRQEGAAISEFNERLLARLARERVPVSVAPGNEAVPSTPPPT